jgi:hypothetical protein
VTITAPTIRSAAARIQGVDSVRDSHPADPEQC